MANASGCWLVWMVEKALCRLGVTRYMTGMAMSTGHGRCSSFRGELLVFFFPILAMRATTWTLGMLVLFVVSGAEGNPKR